MPKKIKEKLGIYLLKEITKSYENNDCIISQWITDYKNKKLYIEIEFDFNKEMEKKK